MRSKALAVEPRTRIELNPFPYRGEQPRRLTSPGHGEENTGAVL